MSKLVKGIKKGLKKIFKGVKKVFKKITKSWIGKIILAALVIYTGGVLLGAWGSAGPMSGMYGAWSGGAAATTSATVGSTAVETAAVLEGAGAAAAGAETAAAASGALSTAAETGAILEGAVAGTAPIVGTGTALSTAAETAAVLEGGAAASETVLGSLWSGIKSTAALAEANPVATSLLMKGVSSALTPDQPTEIDILREQDTLRRERWAGLGTFERTPRLSGRRPATLYQQSAAPWHVQGNKG